MALTNSERQAAYRNKIKDAPGLKRLNIVISEGSDAMLETLAEKHGISKAAALNVAMVLMQKDVEEARKRSAATGKNYRSAFARQLEELAANP